ncbi:MAG TPA: hypothetical protein VD963_01745 [Phycisphaerales bacterium]|nr:hypothetical protein [Phycisphaerales bacterium]
MPSMDEPVNQGGTSARDQRQTEPTGGRSGPIRRPANEIEDHGNIARAGSGERREKGAEQLESTAGPRPGAKHEAVERKSGRTPDVNGPRVPESH